MATQKPTIIDRDDYRTEWFTRRGSLDVNVYKLNADGTRGALICELAYPKISGVGFSDFVGEAVAIAKQAETKA